MKPVKKPIRRPRKQLDAKELATVCGGAETVHLYLNANSAQN